MCRNSFRSNQRLTGRQNVELFARLYDVPRSERRRRVDEALEAMSLLDVADGLAGTYSGGMVRRLELAQALVNRPSLLILDEPTVGLDPIARDGVWAQVRRMQDEFGMTVLADHPLHGGGRCAVRPRGADAPRRLQRGRLTGRAEADRRRRTRRSRTCSGITRERISTRTHRRPDSGKCARARRTARRVS